MSSILKVVVGGSRKGGAVKRGSLVMVAVLALVVGAVVGVVGARRHAADRAGAKRIV